MASPSDIAISAPLPAPELPTPSMVGVPRSPDVRGDHVVDTMPPPSPVERNMYQIPCSPLLGQQIHASLTSFRKELSCDFQDLKRDLCSELRFFIQSAQLPNETLDDAKAKTRDIAARDPSPPVQTLQASSGRREEKCQEMSPTLSSMLWRFVSSLNSKNSRFALASSNGKASSVPSFPRSLNSRDAPPNETMFVSKANFPGIAVGHQLPPAQRAHSSRCSEDGQPSRVAPPPSRNSKSRWSTRRPASKHATITQAASHTNTWAPVGALATNRVSGGISLAHFIKRVASNASSHTQNVTMFGQMATIIKRHNIEEDFHVEQLYHTNGLAQYVAKSKLFNCSILIMICLSAMYMAIDAEYNDWGRLADLGWEHQVCEHVFSSFFTLEIFIRFRAFARKCDSLSDRWFVIDSLLVLHMLVDNYVVGIWLPKNLDTKARLDWLRFFRLLRLARLTRLLRASSDMSTMLKAIYAGTRAVASVMVMLFVLTYSFALVLYSMLKYETVMRPYFGQIVRSMWTLILQGIFMDDIKGLFEQLREIPAPVSIACLLCFVVLSNFVMINILLGIFCEVVSKVAEDEEQSGASCHVREKILEVLRCLDHDSDGYIDKDEFLDLFRDFQAVACLQDLSIDTGYVESMADMFFTPAVTEVPISVVMNLLLRYRTERPCIMGDMMDVVQCQRFWTEQTQQKMVADIKKSIHVEFTRASGELGCNHTPSSHSNYGTRNAPVQLTTSESSSENAIGRDSPQLDDVVSLVPRSTVRWL